MKFFLYWLEFPHQNYIVHLKVLKVQEKVIYLYVYTEYKRLSDYLPEH